MKSPENEADVAPARDPLSLSRQLLSSISSVQSFRGRWIAVEPTVHRLHRSLSSLNPNPNPNPNLSFLLLSLSQTLTLALALSLHSQSSSPPPAGKLRTQSDISTAAADLDRLSSDLDLLLLEEPEEAEDPIKALVSRLQIGSSLSRLAALETLTPILRRNDKNVVIAASHGAVPAIVRLLDIHDTRISAAAAVARVSAVESCREALVAEGSVLLNHLCRVLESDSVYAKENACVALEALTLGQRESATSVASRGGVRSLLEICRSGTPSAAASAAGVLKNLARVKELRQRFIEENAVPVLIRVLSSGTPLAMGNSVGCLRNLAAEAAMEEGGECVNMLLLKEGILICLLNYWEKGCELEPAIGLIRNLALSGYGLHAVHLSGLLPSVVSAMDSLSSAVRAEAARALAEFRGKLGKEEAAAKAIPKLVRMLEAKGSEEKAAAVQALASLVTMSSGNRRAFRREEKGIVNAVMLLDPLVWSVDKRYPVMVLLAVSQSRRCRRQMVACGACEYLKRLVGSQEVDGAKRLKDSLERGKILGVFPRN